MKKLNLITIAITVLLAYTSVNGQVSTDNLVGYWPFNGNANDESGNGNNGTVNGPILTSDRSDNPNSAYFFDGINDFIDCGNNSICKEYSEFTMTIWIKPEIDWVDYNLQNFAGNMYGKQGFMLYEGADKMSLYGGDGGTDWLFVAYTDVIPQKEIWEFFAFTYKNGVISFYHNEELIGQSDALRPDGKISASPNNFLIGKGAEWNKGFFKGAMDDVYIFDRALTETEILQLYTGESSLPPISIWEQSNSDIFNVNTGNVGIGTTTPTYTLSVKGKIGAHEVIVTTDGWADFVFDPTYNLTPLKELDTYIQANKHLPKIPTTAEVEENGISVGEMNVKLLQKIEELTLYVIELQKNSEALQERVKQLEN